MPTPNTITVRLPRIFYEDHVDRQLPAGEVIKTLKNQVDVKMDYETWFEIRSDADYYSVSSRFDAIGLEPLFRSAKRALAILDQYGTTDFQ